MKGPMKPLRACLNFCIFNWPKRIQTPHSLFKEFGADQTTCDNLFARWQSSSLSPSSSFPKLDPLANAIPEDCKINGQALGSWSRAFAYLGRVKRASTKAVPAGKPWRTGLREEKVLQLLLYWPSSRVKNVLICFWISGCDEPLTTDLFIFMWKKLAVACYQLKPSLLSHSIFQSFVGLQWISLKSTQKHWIFTMLQS